MRVRVRGAEASDGLPRKGRLNTSKGKKREGHESRMVSAAVNRVGWGARTDRRSR